MNEHLQVVLRWMEDSDVFVREQAPLVVQEILDWALVKNGTLAAGCGLVSLILAIIIGNLWRKLRKTGIDKAPDHYPFVLVISACLFVIMFLNTVIHLGELVYINVAPRLYIIAELKHMLL